MIFAAPPRHRDPGPAATPPRSPALRDPRRPDRHGLVYVEGLPASARGALRPTGTLSGARRRVAAVEPSRRRADVARARRRRSVRSRCVASRVMSDCSSTPPPSASTIAVLDARSSPQELEAELGVSGVLAQVLARRGLGDPAAARALPRRGRGAPAGGVRGIGRGGRAGPRPRRAPARRSPSTATTTATASARRRSSSGAARARRRRRLVPARPPSDGYGLAAGDRRAARRARHAGS